MSDRPVNLNRVRKARAWAEKRAKGDANAAKFGRSKAERDADASAAERSIKHLDQHRRDKT